MNEESTMQGVDIGAAIEDFTAFEEGWDGDDRDGFAGEADGNDTDSSAEASEADQPTDDGSEGEAEHGEESAEEPAEGEAGAKDQGDSYTLRYLGEERTVDRDEVIKLAQQGMDYSRIREKWDAVKDKVPLYEMYENFLQELADTRDGNIESLIDETRTRALISKAEARGEKLDPAAAARQAVAARMGVGQKTGGRDGSGESRHEDKAERHERMVNDFIAIYGNSVKGTDIPNEVWEEATRVGDLIGPYRAYQNRTLADENKRLVKELEELKQQQNNSRRSTGSARSTGEAAAKSAFEQGWDEG